MMFLLASSARKMTKKSFPLLLSPSFGSTILKLFRALKISIFHVAPCFLKAFVGGYSFVFCLKLSPFELTGFIVPFMALLTAPNNTPWNGCFLTTGHFFSGLKSRELQLFLLEVVLM